MARLARIVVPGHPHHVIQRGNRRQPVFFNDGDYRVYMALLKEWSAKAGTDIWAWCLMPNHVHLILVPSHEDGLRAALAETHRRYTRHVNAREEWTGHLWQSRFGSFPMDEGHLLACARYIERNPVMAGLARKAEDWPWSSAGAHLAGKDDGLAKVAPLLEMVPDWAAHIAEAPAAEAALIESHERTGHPLGGDGFLDSLGRLVGRDVKPRPPGRPKKTGDSI